VKSNHIQFNLAGFLAFSVALVITGAALISIAQHQLSGARPVSATRGLVDETDPPPPTVAPPWGELHVREIELERPEEYLGYDIQPHEPTWTFPGTNREQLSTLLKTWGLTPGQIERTLSQQLSTVTAEGDVVVHPDADLTLSLAPRVRARLYHELGRNRVNRFMYDPYRMRAGDVHRWFGQSGLDSSVLGMLDQLVYPQGDAVYFSDYDLVLSQLHNDSERMLLAKTLSRQRALLVRLRVRPDTDVDKMVGYWASNAVRAKDLRPLLESLRRLPGGGDVSITFALPTFARTRLYTFPTPTTDFANPAIDCHWSTLNFFNETPDDHFLDPKFAVEYIQQHFYAISKASQYGDRVFLIDDHGSGVHSAVYIADDIVFTKNGNGMAQPWVLMRIKDMLAIYGSAEHVTTVVYREKNR
jgi:hypothetical protein